MDKKKRKVKKAKNNIEGIRLAVMGLWTVITNSFLTGFIEGRIYTGSLKKLCLPGLNCYSCPGALGSCPIGSLQAVIGSRSSKLSFYVSGSLIFIGAILGRFVCGWLCPFGLVQDLLNKIPFPKKIKSFTGDRLLRKIKYVIFAVFVILLPMLAVDVTGQGSPWFCQYICPAGMLEGGIPLTIVNEALRGAIGFLYTWKVVILIITVICSVVIYRPFCKYICPLGAVYSLFNKVSVLKLRCDKERCISCGKCKRECKMNVDPAVKPDDAECIRCGQCVKGCPTGALSCSLCKVKDKKETDKAEKNVR